MIHYNVKTLQIPVRFIFLRANKPPSKNSTSVLLELKDDDGYQGYGEACPRSYVTGENLTSIQKDLKKIAWRISFFQADSFGAVWTFIQQLEHCKIGSSTRCLLEMALIDLWANRHTSNVPDFFHLEPNKELRYSLVLPLMSAWELEQFVNKLPAFQPPSVKLRLDKNTSENLRRIEILRANYACPIQVDLRGCWSFGLARQCIPLLLEKGITIFEQPLAKENWSGMAKLLNCFKEEIQLMADESLCSYEDAKKLIKNKVVNAFNLKLSKVGGLGQALAIYNLATDQGIPCQLGAHFSESSLLSRLGLLFAAMPQVSLQALEGCLGTWLSRKGSSSNPVTHDLEGRVSVYHAFPKVGLGNDMAAFTIKEKDYAMA